VTFCDPQRRHRRISEAGFHRIVNRRAPFGRVNSLDEVTILLVLDK
jgi:hypothetical protein